MLLLALFATAWSTQAWAEIKIHVKVEGNTNATPYLYMWKTETDLVSAVWPGDAMTETITTADGVVWYVAEINESNFNLIINNNGNNQSREYSDIHGDKYYAYNSNTGECYNLTYQYEIPTEAHFKDGKLFVYFVNTSEWANPKAHVYNSSENIAGNWPGGTMTKVDNTDNLYVWEKESSSIPSNVIFSNNGDNSTQTSAFDYVNGGYYSSAGLITTITKLTLNSTNFPDANFRSALSSVLGVSEGGNVEPNNVRILDVSNKGISNLTGIEHFTNLEELYAQDNNITSSSSSSNINVSSNTKLKILNVSNNSSLTHIAGIANCHVLEELYLDGIDFWPARQISTSTAANKLSATNNPSLKKLSIAGSALQSSFTLPSFPTLEYLDLSDNSSFNGFAAEFNIPTLKTLKMRNSNLKSTTVMIKTIKYSTGLEYLDLSTNALDSINLFKNTALTCLDLSHNNLFNLNLANQKELVTLNMSYNSKLYCTVNNNSSVNFPSSVTNNGYIYMKNLPKLEEADMSHCGIFRAGAGSQFEGLTALKKLNLSYNDATNGGSYFASITTDNSNSCMQSLSALEELDLTGCSKLHMVQIDGLPLKVIKLEGTGLNTELVLTNNQLTDLNFPNETSLSTLTSLPSIDVSGNPFTVLNIPQTPNSLLTITANDCSSMIKILAEHNASKLQYVTAHNCPALTDMTINGVDMYFNKQVAAFDVTNKSTITTLDFSNNAMLTNYALDGFISLQTVDFSNNYMETNNNNLLSFTATNCPALTAVNLDGNANMETITLKSNGFSNSSYPVVTVDAEANNVTLDFSENNFTAVPNIEANQIKILKLNDNQLADINIPDGCNVQYLYAQNNNFPAGEYTLPATSLVGLDLGNNGFTKFKAENNTSLKSLALAGNTNLTEIELHGNTALTQTSPDGIIESDNGLYIKGLSSLQTLNIENSSFNKLGQQSSLEGCTGLTKLQARHNEFTTFTNGVYALDVSNSGNYRIPDPTESSLEHLTALEYLDLAYNELCDSVHLYKNVALKHLDVSHNNHITGVYDGTITTNAQKQAMIEKKGRHLMKYGQVKFLVNGEYKKKTYGTNVTPEQWEQHYGTTGETNLKYQIARERPFDLRECDLNDTTGLYHLDLGHNVNLEYLDFSYTNIHNTASGPTYMLSGWMDKDWVTDQETLSAIVKPNSSTYRAHSSFHTYVYIIPCSKLKVIHADHNNMQSFGFFYFPKLDTLTISYMYGDCAFMRDVPQTIDYSIQNPLRYNMGGCGLSGSVRKLSSITWGTTLNDAGETITTANLKYVYKDEGDTENYKNPTEFFDVSNSGYNEVRLNNAVSLEYVDVSGNPLNFQVIHEEKDENGQTFVVNNEDYSYYNSLDVTYSPNIRTVKAENCSDLPTVRAHNRTKLDTLYLSNDPKLKTLYIQNDPLLKTNFEGLNTLTGLETLFAYNNTQWGGIDVASNTALKNLWVSNIGASAIDVSKNTLLEKLRVYDNSLEALNVASNPALTWLDLARNQVPELDLSHNTALQYFNCSNSEETLDDQSLAADNHNGGDADEVKPVTSNHSASHTGNSLSDLVFNTSAPVADVRANSNDLHKISGNFTNLTNIEFAHNHINGIDLSAATGTPNINSEDNGRAITAECAKFYQQGQFNPFNEITVFYFQLENINANDQPPVDNSQPLASKTSEDSKGDTRYLGRDGFVLDELTAWDASNSAEFIPSTPSGISPRDVTVEPSNMNQYLAEVPGRIVVLKEDPEHPGEGRATYTYNNGKGESEFYLDWTADSSVPTAIENMKIIEGLNIVNTTDGLTVTGVDGTVVGVYDLNGRQVASETISGGTLTIDGLAPGIYVVNGVKVVVK